MSALTAWNNLFKQFIEHLLKISKTDAHKKKVKSYQRSAEMFKKYNPRGLMEAFMAEVEPYASYINDCNEKYFLNLDVNDVIKDDQGIKDSEIVRELWMNGSLSDLDKAYVWDYLQKLLKLGSRDRPT